MFGFCSVAKKPWLAGCGNERVTTEEKSLGQDQLVLARHAQQVTLPGVFDLDGGRALQQGSALDARALGGR